MDAIRLGWGTADGSTVCDKAIAILAKTVNPTEHLWGVKEQHTRCMEHAVNCASCAFINKVGPVHMVSIKPRLADEDDVGESDDNDDSTADDLADLLGKVLAFINQVHSSPQAHAYFEMLCKQEGIASLQLLKWVRTCWASLYDLVNRILDVHHTCTKFTLLADKDNKVPKLKPPKTYAMFRLYYETEEHGTNYTRPPSDLIKDTKEYEVEAIVNHHHFGCKQQLQYLITWKGYPNTDNMWESEDQVHAPILTQAYYWKNPIQTSEQDKRGQKKCKVSIHSLKSFLQQGNKTTSPPNSQHVSHHQNHCHPLQPIVSAKKIKVKCYCYNMLLVTKLRVFLTFIALKWIVEV